MLPYRLPRESADALVRLSSGAIWSCIETVSDLVEPALKGLAQQISMYYWRIPAARGWQKELHDR
jgi:hypothetical protein